MCSLNGDDGNCESLVLAEKPSFSENSTCRSCTERGLVVLRKKDVYCKKCFLSAENHKFRAALGKSKLMKPQDRVLVAYSGSQSSAALLNLLHYGIEDQHKKLNFSVFVLFIDEGVLFNATDEERENTVTRIKDGLSCYNFLLFISSLSESLKESCSLGSSLQICKDYDKQLMDLFQNVRSLTSKEELLYILRQKMILKVAEQLNCNKVFTAEVGTGLAVKLLSNFSVGRGDQSSFETGFCDSRHPDIKILRPLRDFTKKEIVFYNRVQNVETINSPSLTTKSSACSSIQKLTEKFVTNLQEGFPSTVHTVLRIGEKLGADTLESETDVSICVLCKDKIRTYKNKHSYTAVEAAKFSGNVSRKKLNCSLKGNKNCCGSCAGVKKDIDSLDLMKFLCYGCSSVVKDMENVELLPNYMLQSAVQKRNLEVMKEEISEYLIENSSDLKV